jgi:hypothetical protein
LEGFSDDLDEVGSVRLDALCGLVRIIGLLVGNVDLCVGDAPVAVAAGPALFVKVEVVPVTRIAVVA